MASMLAVIPEVAMIDHEAQYDEPSLLATAGADIRGYLRKTRGANLSKELLSRSSARLELEEIEERREQTW